MTSDSPAEPAVPTLRAGQVIGERYLVGDVLGGGGMGVVQAGTHLLLGTPVAIKVIHSELKGDSEVVQRFINEARAAAALKGEHIARVFDVGALESGEPYLVMEQLDGVSLDQYLAARGALTQTEAVGIVLQVCDGLAEAHAAGLVHRDIKPGNVFLARRPDDELSVKILDFGIAKRLDAVSPALTDPGRSVGSPWYMSPEQMVTPSSVDARADVWSVGVLLFELLTARLPFEGESVPQVCANVLSAAAPRPSQYRADVAPELDAVVRQCLEKQPARRFDSVKDLARALSPFAPGPLHAGAAEAVAACSPSAPGHDSLSPLHSAAADAGTRSPAWRRSWPLALALVAAAAFLPRPWERSHDGVFAAPTLLPDDGTLESSEAATSRTHEPPRLLQYLNDARAAREVERPSSAGAARFRPNTANDAWKRAQQLSLQHEVANRYGL